MSRFIYSLCSSFEAFADRNPLFFYGLFVYFGCIASLAMHPVLFIPIALLCGAVYFSNSSLFRYRILLACGCGLGAFCYVSSHVSLPPSQFREIPGNAHLEVTDIGSDMRYGKTFYRMKLQLHTFEPDCGGFVVTNLPCTFIWHHRNFRPHGGTLYDVHGTLKTKPEGYSFKPDLDARWHFQDSFFSLTEFRYRLKTGLKCFLAQYIAPGDARNFLEGVIIGEFHDNHLKGCLKRFGLQHIIVVSGFHFALVLAIFLALFRIFFSLKASFSCLIVIATLFFLFIGPTPSVFRAYIAALIMLTAALFEKKSTGINGLALGLLLIVLLDPTASTQLSFQLSFLATWAIVLLYPLCKSKLLSLLPKQSQIGKASIVEQLVFVLATFFMTSLALVFAVTAFMLPISIYAFHSFPLLGILYNSFFPFVISIAVTLVILAMLFCWIPPLCALLCSMSVYLTDAALTLVHSSPSWLDMTLVYENLSIWTVVIYLIVLSVVAIHIRLKNA